MARAAPPDLIEAARGGGPEQIERLLEVIWPDAYRLALGILGERQGAEDAAQEACIVIYRGVCSLRNTAAFGTWFYRIVVREALEVKHRRSSSVAASVALIGTSDDNTSIDVWRALGMLPQNLRDVVFLRYFEDLPSREIAAILRTTDGAVRFRLMIAKRRLRPMLDDRPQHFLRRASEVQTNAN